VGARCVRGPVDREEDGNRAASGGRACLLGGRKACTWRGLVSATVAQRLCILGGEVQFQHYEGDDLGGRKGTFVPIVEKSRQSPREG